MQRSIFDSTALDGENRPAVLLLLAMSMYGQIKKGYSLMIVIVLELINNEIILIIVRKR